MNTLIRGYNIETKEYIEELDTMFDEYEVTIDSGKLEIWKFDSETDEHQKILPIEFVDTYDMYDKPMYYGDIIEVYPKNKNHYGEKSVFFICKSNSMWGSKFTWKHLEEGYFCSTHIADINNDYVFENVKIVGNIFEENKYTEIWNFEEYKGE